MAWTLEIHTVNLNRCLFCGRKVVSEFRRPKHFCDARCFKMQWRSIKLLEATTPAG